jgi:transcriptional regulator with XRE-family HTH domain
VQKYEKGVNRISASTLFQLADFLQVSIVYFAEGYDGHNCHESTEHHKYASIETSDAGLASLINIYSKIETNEMKMLLLDLSKTSCKHSSGKTSVNR